MLSVLSSCGEYFKTEKAPHSWEGSITFLLSPLISTAYAEDNICLSTCTTVKCAYLIEHTNSTTSRTICATNADTKYKFDFSEDPNNYFAGKMIEISIVNPDDELDNRTYVEVVDASAPIAIKNVTVAESLLSNAIKGQVLRAMDTHTPDLREVYTDAVANMTIARLNAAFGYLAGYYANLLNDLNNTVEVRKAIKLTNQLEPTFLGVLMSKYQESEIEAEAFSNMKTLCNDVYSNFAGQDFLMYSNRPNCYISLASIAAGSPEAWAPLSEMPEYCVFNSMTGFSTCTNPSNGLSSLETLPSQPSNLAAYTLASGYVADNYTTNNCYTNAYRGGGMVALDNSLQLAFNSDNETIINLSYNSFYALKTYSTCLNDPTSHAQCAAFARTPGIKELQLQMIEDDFCYY